MPVFCSPKKSEALLLFNITPTKIRNWEDCIDDGKPDPGMSLDPYVFIPQHLFTLIHRTSHGNSFYLILLISSYDTISD